MLTTRAMDNSPITQEELLPEQRSYREKLLRRKLPLYVVVVVPLFKSLTTLRKMHTYIFVYITFEGAKRKSLTFYVSLPQDNLIKDNLL